MNTAALQARLQPLFESLKRTQQLIARLSKLPAQPGFLLNDSNGESRDELSDEIHQSLKEQEDEFDLIQQEAEDLTGSSSWARRKDSGSSHSRERERADLASLVTRLGEDLKIARVQFRKAQLQAKRNAEAAKRKERELFLLDLQSEPSLPAGDASVDSDNSLIPNTTTTGLPRRNRGPHQLRHDKPNSQDDIVLGASNDVTSALQRTHALLTAELERSHFARDTLETSTRDLSQLSDRYANLDSLLTSSRSLVSTLINSRKSDTWYLETTVYVLGATISWLVFRRILYGPGWWLIYLPLRAAWWVLWTLLLGPLIAIFSGSGAKGGTAGLSSVGSVVSGSTIIVTTGNRRGIPTFPADMPAPSVRVGAGGQGAKDAASEALGSGSGGNGGQDESVVERIGKMAEDSQKEGREGESSEATGEQHDEGEGTILRERTAEDGPSNPKKRMWEEPPREGSDAGKPRDEL